MDQLRGKWELAVIRKSLRISVLPLASYPNGAYLQAFGTSSEAKLYHFNYFVGHQKREAMMKAGKWYLWGVPAD